MNEILNILETVKPDRKTYLANLYISPVVRNSKFISIATVKFILDEEDAGMLEFENIINEKPDMYCAIANSDEMPFGIYKCEVEPTRDEDGFIDIEIVKIFDCELWNID